MKCSKAHQWIALHREGELEPNIRKRLMEHLAKCESCNQLYRTYKQNDRMAALIRAHSAGPENESMLTGRILNAVSDIKIHSDIAGFMALINRFSDFFTNQLTRRLALACILIIAVSFGYQQYTVYSRITKLEDQLSAAGKTFLAKAEKADMEDCVRKSATYLSGIKTNHRETEKNLRKYFRENPDKMNLYISLLCSRQYKSLKKYANQDYIIIQDIITNFESEIE